MWFSKLALTALLTPCLASVIQLSVPSAGNVVTEIDHILHPLPKSLSVEQHYLDKESKLVRKLCTLKARGNEKCDVDNLVRAVGECGHGGIINLPDPVYTIGKPLILHLSHATLSVHGFLTFTNDTSYWIRHVYRLPFQNQSLAFIVEGNDFVLDGHDTGGIDGNGQAWYDLAKDYGNYPKRNAKNVVVKNWSIIQPQFWASITIDTENVLFRDFYVNATSYNPDAPFEQKSWLQNTDGLDTYRSHNVTVGEDIVIQSWKVRLRESENFVYQGGDDCVALKPNSTSITLRNITCFGGTGIAFGSIGQYEGVVDVIEDVLMEDMKLYPSNQSPGYQGVYFKSWMGIDVLGTGWARNITVRDVYMEDIWHPIVVTSALTYLEEKYRVPDTGTFQWYDIHLSNFTGTASGNRVVWMDCSKAAPCHDWTFDRIDIQPEKTDHKEIEYVCNNFVLGGRDGLPGCHPSSSKRETDSGGTI
ncbi:hypothetical protein P7C73_g1690, partial [Tremellales sp. Uapishka_1]